MSDRYTSYTTAYRTPPIRRRRKRSFIRSTVKPLVFVMVCTAMAYFAVTIVWQNISSPVSEYLTQNAEVKNAEAELAQARRENREIERQIRFNQSPEGAAQAARKLGWVKKGEIVIVLPNEKAAHSKQ